MKKICISKDWSFSSQEVKTPINVDLPHDYVISLPRDPKSAGGPSMAYSTGAEGTYTKYMQFGNDEHVILNIDGAYMCARVNFNENQLIMHPHGYTPFLVDLTEGVNKNKINRISVSTYHIMPSSRWYSGAGLYRDVFLWTGGKIRIEPWDVFVVTKSIEDNKAIISVKVDITSDMDADIVLNSTIQKASIRSQHELKVKSGKNTFEFTYEINSPMLWDTENPNLYTIDFDVIHNGTVEDSHEQSFGIRTIYADAKVGLLLNGKPIKLKGGCIHHDYGALGAAAFPEAEKRKLTKLKSVGFNAVRIAHNPPSLSLLELCDQMGIIVMDEVFDMWNVPKKQLDYSLWFSDWYARDIESTVMRDRNHPCVISYSIGNEIPERDCRSKGAEWSRILCDEVKKHDDTKLVTAAICGFWDVFREDAPKEYNESVIKEVEEYDENNIGKLWAKRTEKYIEPLDIAGYNYLDDRYAYDHELYPERVMWGSETKPLEIYKTWTRTMENNHVIGDFTWTCYDNLGEAGAGKALWARDGVVVGLTALGEYPWRICYQGDFDICGYRRPQSYFRETLWKEDCELKIYTTHPEHYGEDYTGTTWHWWDVDECWTFDDKYLGKPVKVEVYTNAQEVEFALNGKVLGKVKPVENFASIDVMYERGTLTATTYKNGKVDKTAELKTIKQVSKIVVEPEKTKLISDNRDLCYFDITLQDEDGNRVTTAKCELRASCDGGELMGIFSGDPANEDAYTSNTCHAFYGRAVAVVRAKNKGDVTLTVESGTLKSATAKVEAE